MGSLWQSKQTDSQLDDHIEIWDHPNATSYQNQIKTFREKWGKGIDNGATPEAITHAF